MEPLFRPLRPGDWPTLLRPLAALGDRLEEAERGGVLSVLRPLLRGGVIVEEVILVELLSPPLLDLLPILIVNRRPLSPATFRVLLLPLLLEVVLPLLLFFSTAIMSSRRGSGLGSGILSLRIMSMMSSLSGVKLASGSPPLPAGPPGPRASDPGRDGPVSFFQFCSAQFVRVVSCGHKLTRYKWTVLG